MKDMVVVQIEKRLNKATRGEWVWDGDTMVSVLPKQPRNSWDIEDYCPYGKKITIIETDSGYYPPRDGDREFLVNAKRDIEYLLELLK